jgi:hypothetical protein
MTDSAPKTTDLRAPPAYRAVDPVARPTRTLVAAFVLYSVLFTLCDEAAKGCWAAGFMLPTCDTNGVLRCNEPNIGWMDRPDLTNVSPSWWKRTNPNCEAYQCAYRVMQIAGSYNRGTVLTRELINGYAFEPPELVYTSPYPYAVCGAAKGASCVLALITMCTFVCLCKRACILLLAYARCALTF